MKIGKVIGMVWASQKVEELKGCRLYVVQPCNSKGEEEGSPLVVADPQRIGGFNDMVVYVTSTDATQAFDNGYAPVNAAIVQLIDGMA